MLVSIKACHRFLVLAVHGAHELAIVSWFWLSMEHMSRFVLFPSILSRLNPRALISPCSTEGCRKRWYADNPSWLEKLPKRFTNLLPAVLTHKKAICKSVLDELRRRGKSPTDMAKQITELMHLKYERADLAYLLSCKNIMDGEEGKYDQKTITQFLRQETKPAPFGEYGDSDGWNGTSVSAHYLTDCLLHEYEHQQGAITKLLHGNWKL
ncbi:hypothetical protein KUCAC02_032626 [Chaenocephalus aceratus]|nr:hypothetical protein KUCAC02_032626 [Chaenocephalus aceratus]